MIKAWYLRVRDKGDYPVGWLTRKWREFIAEQVFRIVDKNDDKNCWYHNLLQELTDDCPFIDSCTDSAIENMEPMHNEGYD